MKKYIHLIFIFTSIIWAQEPKMSIPLVKITSGYLYVNTELVDGFTREIEEVLYAGIEIKIKIIIELMEKQHFLGFLDKKIKSIRINHKVKYNLLEKNYLVFLIENKKENYKKVKTMEEVKKIMCKNEDIEVVSIDKLKREKYYYIRVKGCMESIELYPPLSYIINIFTPFWNYETKWNRTTQFQGIK